MGARDDGTPQVPTGVVPPPPETNDLARPKFAVKRHVPTGFFFRKVGNRSGLLNEAWPPTRGKSVGVCGLTPHPSGVVWLGRSGPSLRGRALGSPSLPRIVGRAYELPPADEESGEDVSFPPAAHDGLRHALPRSAPPPPELQVCTSTPVLAHTFWPTHRKRVCQHRCGRALKTHLFVSAPFPQSCTLHHYMDK